MPGAPITKSAVLIAAAKGFEGHVVCSSLRNRKLGRLTHVADAANEQFGQLFAERRAVSQPDKSRVYAATALLTGSFALLYWPVITKLVHDWGINENYSHGFLIPPLAGYLVWERRDALKAVPPSPSVLGLVIVAVSFVVLLAGLLGAELFLSRMALLGTLVGGVLFVLGWRHLKMLAFPLGVLLLMIPIPAIIFNQIVFPLQLVASRAGEVTLAAAGIPVLREGNIIVLANTTLEVAEACSGIRSLVSLLTLAIVFGYFTDPRSGIRVAIALSAVPVAIVANAIRVAGTGIAAHYYGAQAAQGFFHSFSGWIVFIAAFAMLFAIIRVLRWLAPASSEKPSVPLGVPALSGE
jgi:exosortase A